LARGKGGPPGPPLSGLLDGNRPRAGGWRRFRVIRLGTALQCPVHLVHWLPATVKDAEVVHELLGRDVRAKEVGPAFGADLQEDVLLQRVDVRHARPGEDEAQTQPSRHPARAVRPCFGSIVNRCTGPCIRRDLEISRREAPGSSPPACAGRRPRRRRPRCGRTGRRSQWRSCTACNVQPRAGMHGAQGACTVRTAKCVKC
jgi:hypothetical protein